MTCWQLLGLVPTEEVKDIKRAYARLLKDTHPEDDPAGFQRLRAAYEQALAAAPYVNETFDEYEEDQEEEIQEIQPTDPYTYDTLPPTPIAQPVQPKPAEPNPWQDLIEEDQRYAQEKSVALWLLPPHQIAPALQNVLKEVRGLSFKEDFLSAFWQHAADRFEEAPWRSLEALYPLVKDDESLLDDAPWQVNQWFSAIRTESNIQQDLKVINWHNWNTWNSEDGWANFCLKLMIGQPPAWWLWCLSWLPNVRKWVRHHLDHYERREPAFFQRVLEPRLPALQPLLSGPVLSSFDVLLAFYPIARYVWLPLLKGIEQLFGKLEDVLPTGVIMPSALLLLVALTAVGAGALATFRWWVEDRLASNTLVVRAESQPAWTAAGYLALSALPWWLPAGFWPLSAALCVLALFWLTRHFSLVTVLALGFIAWVSSFFMLDAGQTDQNVLSFFPWFLGLSTVFAHLLLPPAPVAGEKRSVETNTLFLHWFLTGTFSLLASFLIKWVLY